MQYAHCPACNTPIKSTILSNNAILNSSATNLINLANNDNKEAYCTKCGNNQLWHADNAVKELIRKQQGYINELLVNMPIVTINNPQNWDYQIFGIVTAQSALGTGLFSELDQSISDIFGTQSNSLNSKLRIGEQSCFAQLRYKTIEMGANAVVGADIDFAELGGARGMVMVCSSGTAVYVKNMAEVMGNEIETIINEAEAKYMELKKIIDIRDEYVQQATQVA